jgi:hypothetical protein
MLESAEVEKSGKTRIVATTRGGWTKTLGIDRSLFDSDFHGLQ